MRDEQRRRRSQYDRGTSLAEREEFGYGGYDGYEGHDEDYSAYSPFGYPSCQLTQINQKDGILTSH
jgi:hypothetical protein